MHATFSAPPRIKLDANLIRDCSLLPHSPAEGMYTHATYWKGKFATGMMPQLKQYGNEDLIQTIRCVRVGVHACRAVLHRHAALGIHERLQEAHPRCSNRAPMQSRKRTQTA